MSMEEFSPTNGGFRKMRSCEVGTGKNFELQVGAREAAWHGPEQFSFLDAKVKDQAHERGAPAAPDQPQQWP